MRLTYRDEDNCDSAIAANASFHNNRARNSNGDPGDPALTSWASYGRSKSLGKRNRNTETVLPGLPGVTGDFGPPSPEIEGGEGGRARVGLGSPGNTTSKTTPGGAE